MGINSGFLSSNKIESSSLRLILNILKLNVITFISPPLIVGDVNYIQKLYAIVKKLK